MTSFTKAVLRPALAAGFALLFLSNPVLAAPTPVISTRVPIPLPKTVKSIPRVHIPMAVIGAALSGNDFRLQFHDAYLVYQPGSPGTLQIAAELNVLSYGNDWSRAAVKPFLYDLKLNSWSGFFWRVNTSRHEIYRVTGGTFGAIGGSETPVPNVTVDTVGNPNNPTRFFLRFGDSYLVKPHASSHVQITASNTVLSYGADWTVTQDAGLPWVWHLSESVWKGFSWKVNLRRQRAYRVTDPLNPCATDVRLQADVYAPAAVAGGPNDYDVFGCTWSAEARPDGTPYPDIAPLAHEPANEVVGRDTATATTPAAMTKISVLDPATNAVIASSPAADYRGDYDIRFASTAATRNVVFEVSRLDTGDVLYRSPVLTLAHGDNPRYLLLVGADTGELSGIPFPSAANTGLFTRVGHVEMADIDSKGFAKFAGSLKPWRDAPFGGRLWLFGAFTQNFYPMAGNGHYCYKLRVQPSSGPAYYINDPLYKTRYVVLGNGHVQSQSVSVGPVNGCYLLTPLSTTPQPGDPAGSIAAFWSYPDLLARWNTGSANGLHHVTLELYHMAPDRSVGPLVALIPNDNKTAELYLDNTPVQASFDQLQVTGGGPNLLVNQCAIANLMNGRKLTVDFTADHPNGFMASYSLSARSNSGVIVWSEGGSYTAPAWSGSRPPVFNGREPSAAPFTKTAADFSAGPCAYVLNLIAWARTTNGYDRINWKHLQKFYYVEP